ncbi:MAG: thiamine pyrophosphate-binding protein [Paracoccaceae bacterium]|jgi:acetolactate synthase-1/2/3 large subunit/sulfoacetaldehyde acetyltransferase|nr:thiamine pyrophosphate-binding protein [Paracoccaceae bacterium]
MPKMSGGRAAVEALRANGVDTVFGLIGSATMELFDALYDAPDIRFVGVRDERTGTHMADGYARASGKAGVIIAGQNGPGVTNLVTGIAQARAAYSPVVALAGALASGHVHRDAFQEVDQMALFHPITKKTYHANAAARVPELVNEAFRTALSPRRGPVLVNLPRDVLAGEAEFDAIRPSGVERLGAALLGDAAHIAEAARLLQGAERPLIVGGGGLKSERGQRAVLGLAEALGVPVAMAPGHGDALPFDHRLNAGQVGPRGNEVASRLAREADVILALGTRLGFNSTFYSYDNVNRDAKIVQVEIEPTALGRFFPAEVAIWGDAAAVADELRAACGPCDGGKAWLERFLSDRAAYLEAREQTADPHRMPIGPETMFKALRDVAPADAIYTMDAGTLCLQATEKLNYRKVPALFTPLDFGLVGFSFGCGLGVKVACPDRPVISLHGDGGFAMGAAELATAVEQGINTVTVVMNNQCWGAEKAYQRDFFGRRYIGADLRNPPFDDLARLYGAHGIRVEAPGDLADALREALGCGKPAVVDVMMDPDALYSFRRDSFAHRAKA